MLRTLPATDPPPAQPRRPARELVHPGTTLPRDRVCAMGAQAARGLAAAHAAGIIHLDVKPSNLFLARGGDGIDVVKVIDFGIAELPGRDDDPLAGRAHRLPHERC